MIFIIFAMGKSVRSHCLKRPPPFASQPRPEWHCWMIGDARSPCLGEQCAQGPRLVSVNSAAPQPLLNFPTPHFVPVVVILIHKFRYVSWRPANSEAASLESRIGSFSDTWRTIEVAELKPISKESGHDWLSVSAIENTNLGGYKDETKKPRIFNNVIDYPGHEDCLCAGCRVLESLWIINCWVRSQKV